MSSTTLNKNVRLSENIAPAFATVHKAIKANAYSSFWLKGGRGSTKSSFAAIQVIIGIVSDPDANAIVLRKVDNTVRRSVMENLIWAINKLGMTGFFRRTYSPAEITYIPTGQKIIMSGLDDPEKLKSIKINRGYFKILWFEEVFEFNGMEEVRSVEQSVLRGGEKFIELVTYNPPNDPNAWVNKESEQPVDDRLVHSSTYLDVPPDWLGPKFIRDAETLKRNDPLKYEHEYMGLAVGRAEQIVFHGKWEEREFETPALHAVYQSRFFYGGDWGFANDPTVLTRSFITNDAYGKYLWIEYEAGGSGVEMEEIPALFDLVPESWRWKIYADAARPETISYVARKGFHIEAAPKWTGSVEDGVEYLRGFTKIYVHPRCKRTIEELKKYSYKVDKNTQEILPVLVDAWNHYIDSLRYALADYIKHQVSILDVI